MFEKANMSLLNPTVIVQWYSPRDIFAFVYDKVCDKNSDCRSRTEFKNVQKRYGIWVLCTCIIFVLLTDLKFTINVIKYQIKVNKIIYT